MMIKYLIPLLLLTGCEASVTFQMIPNCDPVLPYDEVTESLGIEEPLSYDIVDYYNDRFLEMANPEKCVHGSNAGWFCDCGQYNHSHNSSCSSCGAGQ